jgi:hypothetical protein
VGNYKILDKLTEDADAFEVLGILARDLAMLSVTWLGNNASVQQYLSVGRTSGTSIPCDHFSQKSI